MHINGRNPHRHGRLIATALMNLIVYGPFTDLTKRKCEVGLDTVQLRP